MPAYSTFIIVADTVAVGSITVYNDILYAEGEALSSLLSQVDAGDLRVNELNAYVMPQSRLVMRGGKYSANIVLAAVHRPFVHSGGNGYHRVLPDGVRTGNPFVALSRKCAVSHSGADVGCGYSWHGYAHRIVLVQQQIWSYRALSWRQTIPESNAFGIARTRSGHPSVRLPLCRPAAWERSCRRRVGVPRRTVPARPMAGRL